MMRQKYTKRQIVEAIKRWESVLQRLDEESSPKVDPGIDKETKVQLDDLAKSTFSDDQLEDTKKSLENKAEKSSSAKKSLAKSGKTFNVSYTFWKLMRSSEEIQASSEEEAKKKFFQSHQNGSQQGARDFKVASVEESTTNQAPNI